jgi:hypothetical protein
VRASGSSPQQLYQIALLVQGNVQISWNLVSVYFVYLIVLPTFSSLSSPNQGFTWIDEVDTPRLITKILLSLGLLIKKNVQIIILLIYF